MTRRSMFALIAVLVPLAGAAGAAHLPQATPIQYWQGPGTYDPGGYLGVYLEDVDAAGAEALALPEERGARIEDVLDESPAAEAGFETDDVVLSWNGTRVDSARQLKRLVSETPAGRKVKTEVFRDGATITLEPVVGTRASMPSPGGMPPMNMDPHRMIPGWPGGMTWPQDMGRDARQMPRPRLGVELQPLSDQLAAFFGLDDRDGVLIASVMEDSAAERAGLRAGDVLLEIDDEPVASPAEVQRVVARKDSLVDLKILRDKAEVSLGADLGSQDEEGAADPAEDEDGPAYPRNAM